MIEIFPTSRCVREFYNSFLETNQLLPKAMTMAEFESKAILVPNKSFADEDTRVLLMAEASKFEHFNELKIQREFLSFLKNSSYLFKFFEELALERVSIEELVCSDTYAQFDEHLEILKKLLENYTNLLEQQSLFDKITLADSYEINRDYLQSTEGFRIHLEGFLNDFELELLFEVAKITPINLILHVNTYNNKMVKVLEAYGFELNEGFYYELELTNRSVKQKQRLESKREETDTRAFTNRVLQSGFVNEKISHYVGLGVKPEDIVVILPDEKFATLLKEFDAYRNLNFAMGQSFTNSLMYKKLDAIDKFIRLKDEIEHKYRISRLKISQNIIQEFEQGWSKKLESEKIIELITFVKKSSEDENEIEKKEQSIFDEEVFRFKALLEKLGAMELQKALKLFLNRLASQSIDDVMGGKVTVMGLLESRGMSFEGVIVVDFTDEHVPKRSKKDMFLSSHVRESSGLPSKTDRENLQRYYYKRLFSNAKYLSIAYVQDEQSMASRFLDELGISDKKEVSESSYAAYLFAQNPKLPRFNPDILEGSYKLKNYPLSASKLKTLLTCKRAFYFKYVMKLKDAKLPTSSFNEADIGTLLHDGLHAVLQERLYDDENELLIALRRYFLQHSNDVLMQFSVDVWMEKLRLFASTEAKRIAKGYRVFALEKELKAKHNGYILEGKIDRIDIFEDKLHIIDYKSGKIQQTTARKLEGESNFQLEFYYLLSQTIGEVEEVYYYNLNKGSLVYEDLFEQKLLQLDKVLETLPEEVTEFEKCESITTCKYCPYVKLCGREK